MSDEKRKITNESIKAKMTETIYNFKDILNMEC